MLLLLLRKRKQCGHDVLVVVLWQASCHCGFVIDNDMVGQAKIVCPNCSRAMCQLCKKVVSQLI